MLPPIGNYGNCSHEMVTGRVRWRTGFMLFLFHCRKFYFAGVRGGGPSSALSDVCLYPSCKPVGILNQQKCSCLPTFTPCLFSSSWSGVYVVLFCCLVVVSSHTTTAGTSSTSGVGVRRWFGIAFPF